MMDMRLGGKTPALGLPTTSNHHGRWFPPLRRPMNGAVPIARTAMP